jgi:ABC-type molybdate transport system substrate-binding protein
LLDPAITLGTSTPLVDPLGDYTWAIFRKAEALYPGSFEALTTKAQQLVGGTGLRVAPGTHPLVSLILETGQAELFLAYRPLAQAARRAAPSLQLVDLPAELAVEASFGLTVLAGAAPETATLALFILSAAGQAILAQHGFDAPLLPSEGTAA